MQRQLQKKDQKELSSWIGGRTEFQLLYKASRDGCSNTAFHQKCDNKGPTVTVFYNTNDCVFGGYTAVSWDSSGSYKTDPSAFLFRLYYKASWSPNMYPAINGSNAIYSHGSYGPMFGAGYDINSFSGTISHNGTYFQLNGTHAFGNSYNMKGNNANTVMCSSLACYDIEVYNVQVLEDNVLYSDPWRSINKYEPEGAVGAGKSSYFNTINSIFRGHVTSQACSGSAEHSLTTQYRKYKIRSSDTGKPVKFCLCDTRGLEEAYGLDSNDVASILDGNIPDKYMFNPSMGISPDTPEYKKSPSLADKIHCVAIVMDGCAVDVFPDKILQNIKSFQQKANQRGIPQVIILTKVDKVCPHVEDDLSKLFYSKAVSELVEKVSQLVGLPRAHVLPVKNYEKEMELVESVDIPALISVRQMLRFADDYLYNYLDEEDD